MITRRNLGVLATGVAAAAALPALAASAGSELEIGFNTYTFDGFQLEKAIQGVAMAGAKTAELHVWHVEPRFTVLRQRFRNPTPQQQALARYQRQELGRWWLTTPMETFSEIASQFTAGGVKLTAFNYLFLPDMTDVEIDRIFLMTKALGVDLITAVGSIKTLRRLDEFAKRHQIRIGIHNEGEIPNVAAFEAAREGLSDYVGYTLDIGHFIANGGDPIAMLQKNRGRIFAMHIKDRKRNGGPTVAFGQGDTPIVEVLHWLRDNRFSPIINIEQEAPVWDRLASAKQAFEYCRTGLIRA